MYKPLAMPRRLLLATLIACLTIGTLELSEDRHILTVKAKNLVGEGVVNFQPIVLKPVIE